MVFRDLENAQIARPRKRPVPSEEQTPRPAKRRKASTEGRRLLFQAICSAIIITESMKCLHETTSGMSSIKANIMDTWTHFQAISTPSSMAAEV